MALTYELWNTASGNRVGEFASQDEALASVRRTMQQHGTSMIETMALGYEDEDGEGEVIARGADLAALAQPRTSRVTMTTYKPFNGLDFSKLLAGPPIADLAKGLSVAELVKGLTITDIFKGPGLTDLVGPSTTDAFISNWLLFIAPIPRLGVGGPAWSTTTSAGLLSFGSIEIGHYLTQYNDDFARLLMQTANFSFSSKVLPEMQTLTEMASDIARRAAEDGGINDQIVALEQHPNARFVYHKEDTEDYIGAIARDEEQGRIVLFAAWRASGGKLAS